MSLKATTLFSASVLAGIAALLSLPLFAVAQGSTAQLVIMTQNPSGTSMTGVVTVIGSGPSLTTTPTSQGSLTYSSSFANESRVITMVPGTYSVSASSGSTNAFAYSSNCSGTLVSGETRTCTVTANQGGSSRVNVTLNVVNNNGGTRTPGDFVILVSGQTPSATSFTGSVGSVQVSLGAGSYSIDVQSRGSYTTTRSAECSGTIATNETKSCAITLDDVPASVVGVGDAFGKLVCAPASQTVRLGQTASFSASGATGPFTWSTSERTYLNIGPSLNTVFGTLGTQSIYVSNGLQTASCIVTVTQPGAVLGTSTSAPGLPNTGDAPSAVWIMLAYFAALVAFPGALIVGYSNAKRTLFGAR